MQGPVEIKLEDIAKRLDVEPVSLRARLYHDLDPRYAQPGKTFYVGGGDNGTDHINFAILEAVVAWLWDERNRNRWTIGIAIASFAISLVAVAVAAYGTFVT